MIVPPDRCVMATYHHLMEECGHCTYEFAPPSPEREEPKYTESDMRVLTEAALRLGRKEAGEELESLFRGWAGQCGDEKASVAFMDAAVAACEAAAGATSGRTDPGDPNGR